MEVNEPSDKPAGVICHICTVCATDKEVSEHYHAIKASLNFLLDFYVQLSFPIKQGFHYTVSI